MTDLSTPVVAGHSESDVRASVSAIVMELAPNPSEAPAEPTSQLVEDLGYHSLALLELAFTLEDEYDLPPIDETTARQITTIEAISDHVVSSLRGRGLLVG